jgi:hypothetical protein
MSAGDVKGFRRRLKVLEKLGYAPKRSNRTVSESVEHNRRLVAKAEGKTKKRRG